MVVELVSICLLVFFGHPADAMEPASRQGWEEAAKEMHAAGGDELLIPEVFEDENLEKWTSRHRSTKNSR